MSIKITMHCFVLASQLEDLIGGIRERLEVNKDNHVLLCFRCRVGGFDWWNQREARGHYR